MIDVSPEQLQTIKSILKQHAPQAEVRVFGSRFKWTAKDHSDLDLVVVDREKIPFKEFSALKDAFEESDLPYRVDVLDWHAISPEFQKVIEDGYEVIQDGELVMSSKGWKDTSLGEITILNYGKSLVASKRKGGDIPVYSSSGLIGSHDTALVNEEGIIIGRKGTVGSVYYSNRPFYCIDTAYFIKKSELKCDIKYLYYLLKTLRLEQLNEDSAVPGLNRDTAYSQTFNFPQLIETQRRIADILSALDEKIELNRQTNATLEALAQSIFREWFVEFNPLQDDHDYAVNGQALPPGWRVGTLGEIVQVKGGTTPSTKEEKYWNGEYNFATPKDLSNLSSPILLDTERKITKEGVSKISSGILPEGTLLLSSRAPIGYLAISNIPVSINQGFIAINAKETSNLFLLYWLKENMETVISRANGSTFLEITKTNFKEIELIIPDPETIRRFEGIVSPIFEQIKNNEQQSATLASTRDALLPKLMRGEIIA